MTDITLDSLTVIRSEASALIRDEIRTGTQRDRLERAVWEGFHKLGASIDSLSEASGLTPAEIRKIVERSRDLEDGIAA